MSNSEEEEEEKDTVLPLNKDLTIGLDMTALF